MAVVAFVLAAVTFGLPGAAARPDHAEVLLGNVTVKHVADFGIAVVVKPLGAVEPDAPAERVFFLQTEEPIPAELPIRMESAEVIYKRDQLIIVSLDGRAAVGLFLSEADSGAAGESGVERLPEHRDAESILLLGGYGLSAHRGRFSTPIDSWPPRGAGRPLFGKSTVPEETSHCMAGGAGASSCGVDCPSGGGTSFGGCEVECRDGYYACCTCDRGVPECKCYEDVGGDDCPPQCEPRQDT